MANGERRPYNGLDEFLGLGPKRYEPYFSVLEFAANSILEKCNDEYRLSDRQSGLLGKKRLLETLKDVEESLNYRQRLILSELPFLVNARIFPSLPDEEKEKWYKEIADIIAEQPSKEGITVSGTTT